jgi:F420-non-reducing hydrogenase iron-sulfur subunit
MTNIRIIRVMCSGRVDPLMVVEAFLHGKDGVAVIGCNLGECHYIAGNYHAKARMHRLRKLLKSIVGLSPERLFNDWVATAEDQKLIGFLGQFYERLKQLGPLGKEAGFGASELKTRMQILKTMLQNERIRWLISKEIDLVNEQNVYGEKIPEETYDEIIDNVFQAELRRHKILQCLKEKPQSTEEISRKIELPQDKVLEEIVVLWKEGSVLLDKTEGSTPIYKEARSE